MALVVVETRPFDATAPMVLEAQLDMEHSRARRAVTTYLERHRRDGKILVSLGSLSHYVQELSGIGVDVRDLISHHDVQPRDR